MYLITVTEAGHRSMYRNATYENKKAACGCGPDRGFCSTVVLSYSQAPSSRGASSELRWLLVRAEANPTSKQALPDRPDPRTNSCARAHAEPSGRRAVVPTRGIHRVRLDPAAARAREKVP